MNKKFPSLPTLPILSVSSAAHFSLKCGRKGLFGWIALLILAFLFGFSQNVSASVSASVSAGDSAGSSAGDSAGDSAGSFAGDSAGSFAGSFAGSSGNLAVASSGASLETEREISGRADSALAPEPEEVPEGLQRYEFEGIEMAVPIRVVLYAEDEQTAKRAGTAALARFHDLNARLSDYDEKSEVRQFCDRTLPGEFMRVSDDLWEVLQLAVHHSKISDGAFDPTVGQVVRLWRHARKSKRMPPKRRIEETLKTVGWQNILFDSENQAIALSENGAEKHVRIDLGGIAKGYAIDEALETLRLMGVTRVLIDAGGDLGLGDPPPGKDGWKIAVASAKKEENPTDFWLLKNCGVAHSGDMFQFVEIDGVRYSHIVDPKTGLGLTSRTSVSIIAPTAADADALASSVSVLGPEKGLALAESLDGVEVQILQIAEDGGILKFGKDAE